MPIAQALAAPIATAVTYRHTDTPRVVPWVLAATTVYTTFNAVVDLLPKLLAAKLIYWAGEPLVDRWSEKVLGRPAFNNDRVQSILATEGSFTSIGFMCILEHLRLYGDTVVLDIFKHDVWDSRFYRALPGNVYGVAKTVANRLFGNAWTPAGETIRQVRDAPSELVTRLVEYDTQLRRINRISPFTGVTLGDFRPEIYVHTAEMPRYELYTWLMDSKKHILTPLQQSLNDRRLKGEDLEDVNDAITKAGKALDDIGVLASNLQRQGEIVKELPKGATHGEAFLRHANLTISEANLRYTIHEVYDAFTEVSTRILGDLSGNALVVFDAMPVVRIDSIYTMDFEDTNTVINTSVDAFIEQMFHRDTREVIDSSDVSRLKVILQTWARCVMWKSEFDTPNTPIAKGETVVPAVSLRGIPDDPFGDEAGFIEQYEVNEDEEGGLLWWSRLLDPLLRDGHRADVLGEGLEAMYALGAPSSALPMNKDAFSPENILELAQQTLQKQWSVMVRDSSTTATALEAKEKEIQEIVSLWRSDWQQSQSALEYKLRRIEAQENDPARQQRLKEYRKKVVASVTSSSPLREWYPTVERLYNDEARQTAAQYINQKLSHLEGVPKAYFETIKEWLDESWRYWWSVVCVVGVLVGYAAGPVRTVKWILLGLRNGLSGLSAWINCGQSLGKVMKKLARVLKEAKGTTKEWIKRDATWTKSQPSSSPSLPPDVVQLLVLIGLL